MQLHYIVLVCICPRSAATEPCTCNWALRHVTLARQWLAMHEQFSLCLLKHVSILAYDLEPCIFSGVNAHQYTCFKVKPATAGIYQTI